ncbi:peroxisome biogenesis protein 16 isoform X2 [Andrographis paniculata]|uniref:peroxisome biogenesis protein 16 isoform X2 n=1 Tax=Andrographis paniculata TaxID=175694 RepID=UPI0021E98E85|nr:peroxisome biogenesis protein 16 isoform X2 [Andrographis paniculata]
MEAYKRWVRRNRDFVHSLESLANGLTWLLPERFSESEIGPEAVSSVLGVFTSVNEHILDTATTAQTRTGHADYLPIPFSLCITLLKDMETLIEVFAQQFYGEDSKWNFIAFTEAVKVFLRLAILRNSGYRMLLQGGESVNDGVSSNEFNSHRNGLISKPIQQQYSSVMRNHHQPTSRSLEGKALSALTRFGENARTVSDQPTWLRRVQHQQAIIEPQTPVAVAEMPSLTTFLSEKGIPGGLMLTGEVMFILRPLVYVLLIRKYGARSWFPWMTSLAVELFGNGITSFVTTSWRINKNFQLSDAEKHELRRRKLLWALYLMRDPFFAKYTRRRLEGGQKLLEPIPIVGLLAEKLVELLVGAQTRYTYMSGS